ncbi:hypothetical protein EPO15_00945 [bacterium]|nr:MAG: hypothetical protein EPO15_00945 [bacterium]
MSALLGIFFALIPAPAKAGEAVGRVITAYPDRSTTKLIIETKQPLVIGNNVYVGPSEETATLGDLMSRSGETYYYSASITEKTGVKTGDEVVTQKTRTLETPSPLTLRIRESYTFENKRKGQITAVQDGRAMIDRGTLHEVRERDLYRIYDASDAYRGLIEIKGIGDLQSSGVLYNRFEERERDALKTVPGDRVVFAGQRKLFALGVQGGWALTPQSTIDAQESSYGVGLTWDIMFRDGWGFELLFGSFERRLFAQGPAPSCPCVDAHMQETAQWSASYIAPFLVKKNFFFPATVSPYLGVGGSFFKADLHNTRRYYAAPGGADRSQDWADSLTTVVPVLAAGIDAFPARFLRPRLEIRWFGGPPLSAGSQKLHNDIFFITLGCATAW